MSPLNQEVAEDYHHSRHHPTKEEVRLTRAYLVNSAVHRAVTEALQHANLTRGLSMPGIEQLGKTSPDRQMGESRDGQPAAFFSRQMEKIRRQSEERRQVRQKIIELRDSERGKESNEESDIRRLRPDESALSTSSTAMPVEKENEIWQTETTKPHALGQIDNTYIVAEIGNKLLIVDQHAAHERVIYERLKCSKDSTKARQLMIPTTIEVGVDDLDTMHKLTGLLQDQGIEVEHFGGNTFILRALPTDVSDTLDIEGMIFDLLDDLRDSDSTDSLDDFSDIVMIRMSCRAAIKSGQHMTLEEQQHLLEEIRALKLGFTCPHGRPTMILLTRTALDKQFKRQ